MINTVTIKKVRSQIMLLHWVDDENIIMKKLKELLGQISEPEN